MSFISFCILCTHVIPASRQLRGACTCSAACQTTLRRERRKEKHQKMGDKICRLCDADRVFSRDYYKCVHCGTGDNLTIDHITPRSRGGLDHIGNLQTLCRSCNSKKGSKVDVKAGAHGAPRIEPEVTK